MTAAAPAAAFRSIFISDLHIGTTECKVDLLLDFLGKHVAQTLYLVGDIVDLRHIGKSRRWLKGHERPILKLLDLIAATHIVVLPGNHDRVMRHFPEFNAPNVQFCHEALHESASGRRYLVHHGDRMDGEIRTDVAEWKVDLACFFYYGLLLGEHRLNLMRLKSGRALRRYVGGLKSRLGFWLRYVQRYETAIIAEARSRGVDGVICGHIHVPKLRQDDGLIYMNTGDWVENCTALVETWDGAFKLIRWDRFGLTAGGDSVEDTYSHA